MPLIGNRKHAEELYNFLNMNKTPTRGVWKKVGEGSFRLAYLHIPTQVVYKYDTWSYEKTYVNKRELHNARVLRKMSNDGFIGKKCRIPKVSGFKFGDDLVLAMEYVKGDAGPHWNSSSRRAAEGRRTLHEVGRFDDMHGYNYFIEKGAVVVPVDMASPRHRNRDKADCRVLEGLPEKKIYQSKQGW